MNDISAWAPSNWSHAYCVFQLNEIKLKKVKKVFQRGRGNCTKAQFQTPFLILSNRHSCNDWFTFTFSLIHASSLSTFLLNSCRFLAPPRAFIWFAAVCLSVCHWSLSWLSCFFTRSDVGFSLQINCSPICDKHTVVICYSTSETNKHKTEADCTCELNTEKEDKLSTSMKYGPKESFPVSVSWAAWVSGEANYQHCTVSKHFLRMESSINCLDRNLSTTEGLLFSYKFLQDSTIRVMWVDRLL